MHQLCKHDNGHTHFWVSFFKWQRLHVGFASQYCLWSRLVDRFLKWLSEPTIIWLLFQFTLMLLVFSLRKTDYILKVQGKCELLVFFLVPRCPWLSECFSSLIPIYIAVIFLFTLANFCMATFMDPGVFPRGKKKKRESCEPTLLRRPKCVFGKTDIFLIIKCNRVLF